jgi:hypothetical protein
VEDRQGLAFRAGPKEIVDLLQRRCLALQRVEFSLEGLDVCFLWLSLEFALGVSAEAGIAAWSVTVALGQLASELTSRRAADERRKRQQRNGYLQSTFVLCSRQGSQAAACLFLLNSNCR